MENKKTDMKVLVGMSGGVDSSVALSILKNKGYQVVGATLKMFNPDDIGGVISKDEQENDLNDAKAVAEKNGCEHYIKDEHRDFKEYVIDAFGKGYVDGLTPNPCVECNKFIKFSKLLDLSEELEIPYIATGHYAKVQLDEKSGRYILKKGKDLSKDQSYMLYNLNQEVLAKVIFPLGNLDKDEIREMAKAEGLEIADKKDSQDICFIKDGDYKGFLENVLKVENKKGAYIDKNGDKIGEHQGIINYTIGQRKGLGITFGKPMFVGDKNSQNNTVTLVEQEDLFSHKMLVEEVNFISVEKLSKPMEVKIKARYNMKEAEGIIEPYFENNNRTDMVKVTFKEKQRAITPGQSAVFYDNDIVVGGGIIKKSL